MDKSMRVLIKIFLVLIILFIVTQVSQVLKPIWGVLEYLFMLALFSGFFYYLARPMVSYFERKGLSRKYSTIIVMLYSIVAIIMIVFLGGSALSSQFDVLYERIKEGIDTIYNIELFGFSVKQLISDFKILDSLRNVGDDIAKGALIALEEIGDMGTILVLTPIAVFFLLKDRRLFYENTLKIVPPKYRKQVSDIIKITNEALTTYISGQAMVALVIGVLSFIGYLIIGLPGALVMGIFNMVFSVIPFVGPIIGLVPAVIIALSEGWSLVLQVIVVVIVVQQIEGNFISPKILGDKLHIHPLIIIVLVTGAIMQFGVIGAFVAVPLYSVGKKIAVYIVENKREKSPIGNK